MLRNEQIPQYISLDGMRVPDDKRADALDQIKKVYGNDVFRPGSQSATNRRIDMRCGHLPAELAAFRDSIGRLRLVV